MLRYQYTNSSEDYEALAQITQRNAYHKSLRCYWNGILSLSMVLGGGAYVLFICNQIFVAGILLAMLTYYFYSACVYKKTYWRAVAQGITWPKGEITLEVTEAGLREFSDEIESFAPWTAVTRQILTENHLFIELSSRLWAVIPKRSLSVSSDPLDSLVEMLTSKMKDPAEP